jgi:hypothetical protein
MGEGRQNTQIWVASILIGVRKTSRITVRVRQAYRRFITGLDQRSPADHAQPGDRRQVPAGRLGGQ